MHLHRLLTLQKSFLKETELLFQNHLKVHFQRLECLRPEGPSGSLSHLPVLQMRPTRMTHTAPIASHVEVGPHPGIPPWSQAVSTTQGPPPFWTPPVGSQHVPCNCPWEQGLFNIAFVFPVPWDSTDYQQVLCTLIDAWPKLLQHELMVIILICSYLPRHREDSCKWIYESLQQKQRNVEVLKKVILFYRCALLGKR